MNWKGKRGRRILSLVFTLSLILGLLPLQGIRAEETVEVTITVRYAEGGEVRQATVTDTVPSDKPASEYRDKLGDPANWAGITPTWDTAHITGYEMEWTEAWGIDWENVDWDNDTMGSLGDLNGEWTFVARYDTQAIVCAYISYCYDAYSEEGLDDGGWVWEETNYFVMPLEQVSFDMTEDEFYDEESEEMCERIGGVLSGAGITPKRGHDPELGSVTWDAGGWGGYCADPDTDNSPMILNVLWAAAAYEKAAVHLAWWDDETQTDKQSISYETRGSDASLPTQWNGSNGVWKLDRWDEETETDVPGGGGVFAGTFPVPEYDDAVTCYWLTGVNLPGGFDGAAAAGKMNEIINASAGVEVTVSMPSGVTELPKEMLIAAIDANKVNVDITFDFNSDSGKYAWTFNSSDASMVPEEDQVDDSKWEMTLPVSLVNDDAEGAIPKNLISGVTKDKNVKLMNQISIDHEGEFVFGNIAIEKGKLRWYVGTNYAGKDVTVYHYNEAEGKLDAVSTAGKTVGSDGYVTMTLTHASDYLIAVSDKPDESGKDENGDKDEDITVEKIAGLPEDFIMGMDISSVMSEFASGVTYKDFEGNTIDNIADFCKLLKANGITHIRVRVWNDPYDADGHGYGGGNNDVKTAKAIAEGCRAAGLKMLVDFHCSDFWADPYKYQEPKAWYGYTLEQKKEALKSFICEALNEIDASKDTVAMVQVGNETINGFVGEEDVTNMCTLFQAGAEGVRKYNPEAKVVIQVTEPQNGQVTIWAKNLSDNKVEYDILATSYYPYWHGSLENLKSELEKVKTVYRKETMVVETSYAYTLDDSDGCGNIVNEGWPDGGEDIKQPFTVQGQATAVRDLMSTVNEASGLGVFYWEPAWLTVGDTTGLEGEAYEAQVSANWEKWETYGSGWASSYAGTYDPYDAGVNYGGTAVENQAMFYPDGTPTAALHVWNYVKPNVTQPDNSNNTPSQPGDETITISGNLQYDGWAGVSAEQKAKLMRESLAKSESAKVTAPKTDDSNAMAVGLFLAIAAASCGAVVVGKKKLLMK